MTRKIRKKDGTHFKEHATNLSITYNKVIDKCPNLTRRADLAKTHIEADALETLMSEDIERYFDV